MALNAFLFWKHMHCKAYNIDLIFISKQLLLNIETNIVCLKSDLSSRQYWSRYLYQDYYFLVRKQGIKFTKYQDHCLVYKNCK